MKRIILVSLIIVLESQGIFAAFAPTNKQYVIDIDSQIKELEYKAADLKRELANIEQEKDGIPLKNSAQYFHALVRSGKTSKALFSIDQKLNDLLNAKANLTNQQTEKEIKEINDVSTKNSL